MLTFFVPAAGRPGFIEFLQAGKNSQKFLNKRLSVAHFKISFLKFVITNIHKVTTIKILTTLH
jgi:hypothetical protein